MLEEPQAAFYAWIERHRRLASARQQRRPDSGRRYRRRHHRFHADRRHRTATANCSSNASPSANTSCSAATTSISLWPTPSPAELAAKGTKIDAFQLQALWNNCRLAKEKLLDPESQSRRSSGHHPRQRFESDRRHHQSHIASRAGGTGSRRLSSARRQHRYAAQAPRRRPPGNGPALRVRCRDHPPLSRASCEQGGGTPRLPHPHPLQRRRPPRAVRARAPARRAQRLAERRGLARPAAHRRRSDARRRARRGLLRRGAARQRRAHSRRHRALLLRRNRIRHARRTRHAGARARPSPSRSSAWKKAPTSASRPRIRPDRR